MVTRWILYKYVLPSLEIRVRHAIADAVMS